MFEEAQETDELMTTDQATDGRPATAGAVRNDPRRPAASTDRHDNGTGERPVLVPKADRRRHTRS